MQVIRNPADAANIADPAIRQMILQRIDAIASDEPYDATQHGYFVIIESGDTSDAIAAQVGFDVLTNRWTGLRYDHADYTPAFEILEEYQTCWDLLFIQDDSGYGIELFLPKTIEIPDLVAMCQRYAVAGVC